MHQKSRRRNWSSCKRTQICEVFDYFLQDAGLYHVFSLCVSFVSSSFIYSLAFFTFYGILRTHKLASSHGWLDNSVGRALHRYRRCHGFESCSGPNFFRINWPAPSWLDNSVGRALHRYRRCHGFESRSGPNFF